MPTLGFITVKPGDIYHANKVSGYGSLSSIFVGTSGFKDAKLFVEGSVGVRAKVRDVTRSGAEGGVGGPKTYEVYT